VARRRGSLLLVAFLAAVIAGGGGGVTAPWLPGPTQVDPTDLSVGHAIRLKGGSTWRLHRME
jgi:hypothetical protein